MADDTYLFIDGEYLRQIHREAMLGFFGVEGELDISEAMDQARAVRAFPPGAKPTKTPAIEAESIP